MERVTQAEIPLFPAIGKELFHTIRKTFLRRNQQIDFQYFFLQELVYIFFVFPLFKSYNCLRRKPELSVIDNEKSITLNSGLIKHTKFQKKKIIWIFSCDSKIPIYRLGRIKLLFEV